VCYLRQAFALIGMYVTPNRTPFKFVQNILPGLNASFTGKLIP